jgi:type IV secretion system protein TrbF
MIFKRAVQRYGNTPQPETPYQKAGQLWDERIGSARVQARNWRLMAFGGLFLSTALSGGLLWQSMQSRVVPYVVAVDHLGEPQAISLASATYQPTDPQIAWHLAKFIANVRGLSLDPVVVRDNWLAAYDVVTDRGSLFLSDHARSANPFGQGANKTVSIQVTSVVRASETSFQVKWSESQYERGSLASTSHWTAILTVIIQPPKIAEVLRKNPLGLYVDAIAWSRELETTVTEVAPDEQGAASPAQISPPSFAAEGASNEAATALPVTPERTVP